MPKGDMHCDCYDVEGHTMEQCGKFYPKKKPKWLSKSKKNAIGTCRIDDNVDCTTEVDNKLTCIANQQPTKQNQNAGGKVNASTQALVEDAFEPRKEDMFWDYIQSKMMKVVTLYDSGSQRNIISKSLVQQGGLVVKPHTQPYLFKWLHKDVKFFKQIFLCHIVLCC